MSRSVDALSFTERNSLWRRLDEAVSGHDGALSTPVAVVDLDAFDANADDLVARSHGVPVRVASKSLRVPALIERALAHPGFSGVLGFTLAEGLWLSESGICDDVVVAYPSVDRAAIRRLLSSAEALASVTVMVDDAAHLDLIDRCRDQIRDGSAPLGIPVRVCLDVDAGLHLPKGHVGPRRSPLRDVESVAALAAEIARRPGFRLVGVMTYEGQVAGLADAVPGQAPRSTAIRALKHASVRQLTERRARVLEAVGGPEALEFFNAGGSGSLETSSSDPAVTEVTAGSGLLVSRLFDHYRAFSPRPAAFFGLPVTRRPDPATVTVHGGGLIASGATGADRSPTPWAPPGLALTGLEGAGEVQTPLTGAPTSSLAIGDLVWFRHAKSGELFEHVPSVHLLQGRVLCDEVSTYRGEGLAF